MRPSGVPVCLMPVQQHELGGPASVVDMVGRIGCRPARTSTEPLYRGPSPAVTRDVGHTHTMRSSHDIRASSATWQVHDSSRTLSGGYHVGILGRLRVTASADDDDGS